MRIFKAAAVSMLILFYLTTLSGCWNYREIEEMSIVAGLAIDRSQDNQYLMTVEIAETQGGQEAKTISKTISGSGDTLFETIRNLISLSGKRLYWAHTKILILSQDISKDDIIKILDWLNRDAETRADIYILVSREKTAKELLENRGATNEVVSFQLEDVMRNEKSLAKFPAVQIADFIIDLAGAGISPIAPAIGLVKSDSKQSPQIIGSALFAERNMTGILNGEETKYLLFVRDKIKGGLLVEDEIGPEGDIKVTLEIFKSKTKVKPVLNNDEVEMVINIETDVAIDEIQGTADFMVESGRAALEKDTEQKLNEQIESLIEKVQSEYDSDIFGFGAKIKQDMPEEWRNLESDWKNGFKTIKVTVNSMIKIKNSGQLYKPLPVGD